MTNQQLPSVVDDGASDNPLAEFVKDRGFVAYHGTSSAYSESIERHGLSHEHLPFTSEECGRVVEAFRKLEWYGWREDPNVGSGIGVLAHWGPSRDRKRSGHRHVYLAETYGRATIFANFPGGETVCALRHSIEQLVDFVERADLRQAHVDRLADWLRRYGYTFDASYSVTPTPAVSTPAAQRRLDAIAASRDIEWLQRDLVDLAPLLERIRSIAASHQPVVYAIQVDPNGSTPDYVSAGTSIGLFSPMGIEVMHAISPDRLLGKAMRAGRGFAGR